MNFHEGKWDPPQRATFIGNNGLGKCPRISMDNNIIYNYKGDLYECKYENHKWTGPIKFPDQINSDKFECVGSMASDESMYYASHREGTKGRCDIFYSKYLNGSYETPVNIDVFNSDRSECNILISPKNDSHYD